MRVMKILICNWRDMTHPAAGGAEVYTDEVIRRWSAQGHQVTHFSAAVEGQPDDELAGGIRFVRRGSRFSVYREAASWYTRHGRGRFDLVIDEANTRPFFAHEWADDTSVVALFHQTAEEIWFHEVPWPAAVLGRYVLEPRWLRRYRTVPTLTVSPSSQRALEDFGLTDVEVVPEGLTLPDHLPRVAKETRPTVAFVGRLVSSKRPFDVLDAFERVRSNLPDAQLWMIGGGPLEDAVRRAAPRGVEVLGRVSQEEKYSRMARAHALLATSVREGWGLVVAEAAAVGTRTIGYDAPGLRDAVAAAEGVLVPADPTALAAWMAQVLPRWMASPPGPVHRGGVASWDEVADTVLERAVALARPARRPIGATVSAGARRAA